MSTYVTAPPLEGTYIRQGHLQLVATATAEVGEVFSHWTTWHLQGPGPSYGNHERYGGMIFTRCGQKIAYQSSGRFSSSVIATTDAPGDAACVRCERRPGVDRRFLQALESGLIAARILINLMPEANRPTDTDEELRRKLTLELLRRGI